ncbi:MAG: adenylate/guanylate cyclase domain-containing protein [Cyanobacteriota bacterium]|nr:adenylate/guanylate cyclase domain-containing protein [Cyanobacteriota bacterium]
MLGLNRLSIKSKLQIMLLVASLGSILVVGYLSWSRARATLSDRIFSQLTSVRASKAYQIESYFRHLRNHLETLCEDRMMVSAMLEFEQTFARLEEQPVPPRRDNAIARYYTQTFLPRLAKNIEGTPTLDTYLPRSAAARYLQFHYIANNPAPVGEKDNLNKAKDGSEYSEIHARYHPLFRNLIEQFGYYDLFLINSETGEIAYSVYKETDYGTSLDKGPYRNSNLAKVVQKVRENPDRGAIQIVDFDFYRPSYNAPTAFIAGPIYDGTQMVGILAVQLPVDEINNVLTGNRNWKRDGLGNTGEVYLVGADLLMRSAARPLLENSERYVQKLEQDRVAPEKIGRIEQLKTSILLQEVDTDPAKEAIARQMGTQRAQDYLGISTLSSFAPLDIPGVNWGIVAQMNLSEAYQPVNALQFQLLASTVILVLLVLLYAAIASYRFVKPIDALIAASRRVERGDLETEVVSKGTDEFNELAQILNRIVRQFRDRTAEIAQKREENEVLLRNILPDSAIARLRKGETPVADRAQSAAIAAIGIRGLTQYARNRSVEEAASLLNEWVDILDETASKYGVERLILSSDRYIACCGLTEPRLDCAMRMVDFALDALKRLQNFNLEYDVRLSLRIGIDVGSVMAGIVGRQKFRYAVWGETVDIAHQLEPKAEPNTILVTQEVRDRIQDLHPLESGVAIAIENRGKIPTWVLGKTGMQNLISELTLGLDFDEE